MHQRGLCLCPDCVRSDIAHEELARAELDESTKARIYLCGARGAEVVALARGVVRRERKAA